MKTLQDLVDELNKKSLSENNYFTAGDKNRDYLIGLGDYALVLFSLKDKTYSFTGFITFADDKDQDLIVKYLANHTPDDWFAEKKYNIVLNNLDGEKMVINKYDRHNPFSIECSTGIDDDELKLDAYIFTESEIEQLKLTLPTNMAKIVDLGKVEVKDEIA